MLKFKSRCRIFIFPNWLQKINETEKVPWLQSPSSHGSSKLLLCAHSSPPWQLRVLVLMQFASQTDHALHALKQNIFQYFVQGLPQELSKSCRLFLGLRCQPSWQLKKKLNNSGTFFFTSKSVTDKSSFNKYVNV